MSFLDSILTAVDSLWSARFSYSANVALIHYEYFITLDQERLVWKSKSPIMKTVFFLNRYIPFAVTYMIVLTFTAFDAQDHTLCYRAGWVIIFLNTAQLYFAQLLLYLRAFAAWERNKYVGALAAAVLIASGVMGFYHGYVVGNAGIVYNIKISSPGCIVGSDSSLLRNLIILTVSELGAVGLLVAKALWHHYRYGRVLQRNMRNQTSILTTLLRDGMAYFTCILALSATNMFLNAFSDNTIRSDFVALQATVQSILCIRLVFHVINRHGTVQDDDEDSQIVPHSLNNSSSNPSSHSSTNNRVIDIRAIPVPLTKPKTHQNTSHSDLSSLSSRSQEQSRFIESV